MRIITVKLCQIGTNVITIGFEGENKHTHVVFDASDLFADYPNAIAGMAIKPPVGDIYPKVVTRDGGAVVWDVTASDCASGGNGEYQLTFTDDEEVIKTYVGKLFIMRSLTSNGEAPDPIQDWIDEANEALGTISGAVERAENAATASETAQGKAEDAQAAAETAQALAEAAEEAAEVAEAGAATAQGKAEDAQAAAESARDTTEGYVTEAQGYASDAQGYANDAAGSAETAGDKAQEASGYADNASGYASDAQGYANDASGYADSASGYATQASGYADDASGYATTAGNKATEAGQSATAAAGSATTAGNKATEAGQSATSASASALKAEGFAVGQQNGTDVTSGSPYFENNAKYYSEQAEQSAEDAEQTVVEVTNKLNSKAPVVIENASGSIATFTDGADGMPMSVVASVEPVQDLHGQANPYPPGGGKNIMHPVTTVTPSENLTVTNNNGKITINGSATQGNSVYLAFDPMTIHEGYIVALMNSFTSATLYFLKGSTQIDYFSLSTANRVINTASMATLYGKEFDRVRILFTGSVTLSNANFSMMVVLDGADTTTWSPYSNICPISGWTGANVTRIGANLLPVYTESVTQNGITYTANADGSVTVNGTATATNTYTASFGTWTWDGAQDVWLSGCPTGGNYQNSYSLRVDGQSGNWSNPDTGNGIKFARYDTSFRLIGEKLKFCIVIRNGTVCNNLVFKPMLNFGNSALPYEPYQGETYPITFPSSAGTVYGGTLTVNDDGTGVLVVDRAYLEVTGDSVDLVNTSSAGIQYARGNIAISGENTLNTISNTYVPTTSGLINNAIRTTGVYLYIYDNRFVNLQTAKELLNSTPVQLVYERTFPVTYTLTDLEVIETLKGLNNVWADTGDVSADYPADTKLYIAKELYATQKMLELIVTANREETMKATKAYSTGDLLIVNGTLYKATTSIANGATLTVGTNVATTTIAAELAALA